MQGSQQDERGRKGRRMSLFESVCRFRVAAFRRTPRAAQIAKPVFLAGVRGPIFGLLHPSVDPNSKSVTLICQPLFSEYSRAHFSVRHLAVLLSCKGQNVFRLDLSGTGDSAGDIDGATLQDWLGEIRLATREILRLTGSTRVNVIGIRVGALLAAKALAEEASVGKFVFWDAVSSGREFLAGQKQRQWRLMAETPLNPADYEEASLEYGGNILSPGMVRDLENLTEDTYRAITKQSVYILTTKGQNAISHPAANYKKSSLDCSWQNDTEDCFLVPGVASEIVQCLAET
jgi:pimeloyl-ACP methyl ester carboxylesterase